MEKLKEYTTLEMINEAYMNRNLMFEVTGIYNYKSRVYFPNDIISPLQWSATKTSFEITEHTMSLKWIKIENKKDINKNIEQILILEKEINKLKNNIKENCKHDEVIIKKTMDYDTIEYSVICNICKHTILSDVGVGKYEDFYENYKGVIISQ